jgi:ABC-2 type transport system permease protein
MTNTMTILRRELAAYFNSPLAYIVVTVFLLACGIVFFSQAFLAQQATMRDFFGYAPFVFLFFAPAVSMRLLAEEKRSGTLELLITMPVGDWEVVLGKFFAAVVLLGVATLMTLAYPVTLSFMGDMDWGSVAGGYLGLLLLWSAYIAIGLMVSSWTKNQVIAFIISWAITFTLYICGKLLLLMPDWLVPLIGYLSPDTHFSNIAKGVIDSRDVIYFLSITGVCLFLAVQSLASRRWR